MIHCLLPNQHTTIEKSLGQIQIPNLLSFVKKTGHQTEIIQRRFFRTKLYQERIDFQSFQTILPSTERKRLIQKEIDNQAQLPAMHRVNKFNSRCPRDRPRSKWPTSAEVEQDEEERDARVKRNERFSKGKGRIVRGQFRKGDLLTAPPRPIKRARPRRGNSSSTRS